MPKVPEPIKAAEAPKLPGPVKTVDAPKPQGPGQSAEAEKTWDAPINDIADFLYRTLKENSHVPPTGEDPMRHG